MQTAEVTLPGHVSSVPTARRFVESVLSSWGYPDAGWIAAVCVSELAANCALHAHTEFTVRASVEAGRIRVEVADGSRRLPVPRHYGTDATTGRGLRMVEELAAGWGVQPTAAGKVVWLLLEHSAPAGPLDADDADLDAEALLASFDEDLGGSSTPRADVRRHLLAA